MTAGVRPDTTKISAEAIKANKQEGYGPNNPEPMQYHLTADRQEEPAEDALQAAIAYIEHKQ